MKLFPKDGRTPQWQSVSKVLHCVEGKMVIQAVTVLGNTILYNKGEMVDERDEVTAGFAIAIYLRGQAEFDPVYYL